MISCSGVPRWYLLIIMHLAKFSHISNDSQYEMNVAIHLEIHLLETLGGSHYRPQALFLLIILSTEMSFWRFGSKESDRSKIIASLITTVIHSNGFLPTKYQFNSNVFLPTKSQFNSNIFLPTKYQFNSNSFPFEKNQFNSNGFLPTKINSIQMISFLLKIYLIQSAFLLSNIYPRLMPIEIVKFLWFFLKKILFAEAH